MAEKHYSNDWAKSKSRDLVRDMIKRTLLGFRRPKDLRVLCFPGIDAQEIFEVYDPLGIPRKNIIGLEQKKDIAKEITRKNLGIQVVPMSDSDYAESQSQFDIDVLSLDYTGPINEQQVLTIGSFLRKNMRNQVVLHSANLIRRDGRSNHMYNLGASWYSGHHYLPNESSEKIDEALNKMPMQIVEELRGRINGTKKKIDSGESLSSEKVVAYSALLMLSYGGMRSEEHDKMLKFAGGEEYSSEIAKLNDFLGQYNIKPIDVEKPFLHDNIYVLELLMGITRWALLDKFRKIEMSDAAGQLVFSAIQDASKIDKWFTERDVERYSYISESGSPMIGDILFLTHPYKRVKAAEDISRLLGFPYKIELRPENTAKVIRAVEEYRQALRNLGIENYKKIHMDSTHPFLGNSSRPVLTKGRAIKELMAGATIEQVQQKYRGWENKPLAQWKAHVTMGTYGKPKASQPGESLDQPIQIDEEDSGLEKITKGEAIDLLASGIPAEEIYAAYPTSYSARQLAAFKAHVTMGTYKNSGATI